MRYLDIDKTIKAFEEQHCEESTLLNCYNADWIVSFLEAQPTADVQEVFRCKDCKYSCEEKPVFGITDYSCIKLGIHCLDANDFCSYGERRKGDGTIHCCQ